MSNVILTENNADNGAGVHINSLGDTYTNAYFEDNVHFIQNFGNRNVGLRIYGNVWTGIERCHFVGNQANSYGAAAGFTGGVSVDVSILLLRIIRLTWEVEQPTLVAFLYGVIHLVIFIIVHS